MIFKVEDFCNLEKVTNIFQSVNGLGNTNCIIVALDQEYNPSSQSLLATNSTIAGAKIGGIGGAVAGGIVGSAIQNSINEQLKKSIESLKNPELAIFFDKSTICGWIINFTERGIGFIPLTDNKKFIVNLRESIANPDSYVFVENQYIKGIELKNKPLNFKKDKKILKIIFNDGTINPISVLMVSTKSDVIEYQEENFKELSRIIENNYSK